MGPLYPDAARKLSGALGSSRIIKSGVAWPGRRAKGSGMNGERKLAMFMDFENIARGVKEAQYKQFELKLVLERLLEKGKIIVRRAYADWNRFTEYKRPFHEWAIELIDVPQSRYSGKNSADIRMVVDALDLAYGKTHIDSFALVSGDSDFSPLVSKLRENDRYVIGLGVKSSSSDLLVANCDEFIFYEDLIRDTKKTTLLPAMPEKKAEAMAQLIDAIQALQRENKETLWGSMVKQTMIRKNPAFNETYYGFSTFSKLLEDAAKQRIVTLERDEKSGTYVITALSEEGGRAPERGRMRPVSWTKTVRAQLTTEITSAPQNAGQKPATSKPGTSADVSHRQNAFRTKRNRPSVRSVSGRVRILRNGLTTALMRARTRPARSAGQSGLPRSAMPGTTCAAK